MNRFLFDPAAVKNDELFLSKEESRHISKVLRMRPGTEVELFDGTGIVYRATIVETGERVKARMGQCISREERMEVPVWVAQGLLKGKKMDLIVQKCTELGAARFSSFVSSRCQGKPDRAQNRKKKERWQRLTIAACKQCMRRSPPVLDETLSFSDLLALYGTEPDVLRLLFWEEEKSFRLRDLPSFSGFIAVCLLLGPEGGLTAEEVELARSKGWQTVTLGERVLRAETANLSAVAIVQHLVGNI
jgi:16S rRNA (uracil1498-N3)-methyltransferase